MKEVNMQEIHEGMKKKVYQKPVVEIILFPKEDVITASGLNDGGLGDGDDLDWGDLFP
jgi:hypothetical protein